MKTEKENQSAIFNIGSQNAGRDIVNSNVNYEWILVSERLPETNTTVLVTDGVKVTESWFGKRTSNDEPGFRFVNILVTHWMPLPEVPKQ